MLFLPPHNKVSLTPPQNFLSLSLSLVIVEIIAAVLSKIGLFSRIYGKVSDNIQESPKLVFEDIFPELNCKNFSAAFYFHSADL
jgi:hypothetical protein